MELWAGGYKYEESANKVAEMLEEHGVKVTVEPSKKGKYHYPAWDVLVEGTKADAYRKLSGIKPEETKAEPEEVKPVLKGIPNESWRLQDMYHWAKEQGLDIEWPISKDALLERISKIQP